MDDRGNLAPVDRMLCGLGGMNFYILIYIIYSYTTIGLGSTSVFSILN